MNREAAKRRITNELKKNSWCSENITAILSQLRQSKTVITVNDEELIFFAARVCNTTIKNIKGKGRQRKNVVARSICYNSLRNRGYTLQEIGKMFNKHHSTILFGLKAIRSDIHYDAYSKEKFFKFEELINK